MMKTYQPLPIGTNTRRSSVGARPDNTTSTAEREGVDNKPDFRNSTLRFVIVGPDSNVFNILGVVFDSVCARAAAVLRCWAQYRRYSATPNANAATVNITIAAVHTRAAD